MAAEAPSEDIAQMEAEVASLWQTVLRRKKHLGEAKKAHDDALETLKALKHRKTMTDNKKKIEEFEKTLESSWIQRQFDWSEKANLILKNTFKFESFRPKQLAAINATLSGKDVILIMPTGGGKSLVYQLPAIINYGVTIVISPLLSLIEDQLQALSKIGVKAASINSATEPNAVKKVYADMLDRNSELKLLYLTPEYIFKSKRFFNHLTKCYEENRISRLAIDEVHCCSTWGHDFRQHYGMLDNLREILPDVPTLGVTATATREVLGDILEKLKLEDAVIITAPFNRPNLYYSVIPKPRPEADAIAMLEKLLTGRYKDQTGIIYTSTIKETENLAQELKQMGLKVAPYHAQLEPATKKRIYSKWVDKRYQVVIATIAFGMGIDLSDVRFVIHHAMPSSLEGLYQESGRAGRDGLKADCVVMFSLQDYLRAVANTVTPRQEMKIKQVLEYCLETKRRAILAGYFGEPMEENVCQKMCDLCSAQETTTYNLRKICTCLHAIIEKASSEGKKLTFNMLLEIWYGKGQKKFRVASCEIPKFTTDSAALIIGFLIIQDFLQIEKNFNMYTGIAYVVKGKPPTDVFMQSHHKLRGVEVRIDENLPNKRMRMST